MARAIVNLECDAQNRIKLKAIIDAINASQIVIVDIENQTIAAIATIDAIAAADTVQNDRLTALELLNANGGMAGELTNLELKVDANELAILANTATLSSYNTNIELNTSGLATIVTDLFSINQQIDTNKDDIVIVNGLISDNGILIHSNATNITDNGTLISNLTTVVGSNTSTISDHKIEIDAAIANLTTIVSGVSGGAADVIQNTTDIIVNAQSIIDLTSIVNTNTANITTGVLVAVENAQDIDTNTADIISNDIDIAQNKQDISTNFGLITVNISDINDNKVGVATNANDITLLSQVVNQNTADIITAGQDILDTVGLTTTNTSDIADGVTNLGLLNDRVVILEALDFTGVLVDSDVLTPVTPVNLLVTQADVLSPASVLTPVSLTNMILTQADLPATKKCFIGSIEFGMGIGGGTSESGVWKEREINTFGDNTLGVNIVGQRMEVPAGEYEIEAICSATGAIHQSRLFNMTAGTVISLGTTESSPDSSASFIDDRFTLMSTSSLALQTIVDATVTDNGFGIPCPFGQGVFVKIKIQEV